MHEEVEIKVSIKNTDDVMKFLSINGNFLKERHQRDEYFVLSNRDFFREEPVSEYLRIRKEDGNNQVAYHFCHYSKNGKMQKTDEYETAVSDPEMMSAIFIKLGMISKVVVDKKRKYFEYKGYQILIDHIEKMGYFLEIETESHEGNYELAKINCYQVLNEIGAKWEETPDVGYPDMLLKKMKLEKNKSQT